MCPKCNNTGSIETGTGDLPCDCPFGDTAQFRIAGVGGLVTGREIKQYLIHSEVPLELHKLETGQQAC